MITGCQSLKDPGSLHFNLINSKWIDLALIVCATVFLIIGTLASLKVFQAAFLYEGMYIASGICVLAEVIRIILYCCKNKIIIKKNLIKKEQEPLVHAQASKIEIKESENVPPNEIFNSAPLTLQEQASRSALSFKVQTVNLPNVSKTLEKIQESINKFSKEQLIKLASHISDEEILKWQSKVIQYINDRQAWPPASGRYSFIRQLLTDPNINESLYDPNFIIAIFRYNRLGAPLTLCDLNIEEAMIAGFRDQHPASLECQPYNNALFIEDVNLTLDPLHVERLFKTYLLRKECSFLKVMFAIQTAAQNMGLDLLNSMRPVSRFDMPYDAALWKGGAILECFKKLKQAIRTEKDFIANQSFQNSYGQALQGFIELCSLLNPNSHILNTKPNFSFISSERLAQQIADHPTILLEYHICHLYYDIMHFTAILAGQAQKYKFEDGEFSMLEILEKTLIYIQKTGLNTKNSITAQQLYLRLFALADLRQI